MKTHKCSECNKVKPVDEFRKHFTEGPYEPFNLRMCKVCSHMEYIKRRSSPSKYRTLKKANRQWKQKNPERHAEMAKEYRKRHPEKIVAQNRLNYAIRCGKITRNPCEKCGARKRVHAHHVSYKPEDWLNVRWLCFKCHKSEHAPWGD